MLRFVHGTSNELPPHFKLLSEMSDEEITLTKGGIDELMVDLEFGEPTQKAAADKNLRGQYNRKILQSFADNTIDSNDGKYIADLAKKAISIIESDPQTPPNT
jgi:hypothetical protein